MSRKTDILKNLQTPQSFRDYLVFDPKSGDTLGKSAEPWQRQDFEATDQGWRFAARVISDQPQHQFAYLERPRSHSKTMDTAAQVLWALAASPFKITGIAASGDTEQAKFLRNAIDELLLYNPGLDQRLKANNYVVKNEATCSTLNVISSDASSSFGWTPDFVVCDEFTHWGKGGAEFFDSLVSSAGKRPNCFFVIISNAGRIQNSWQWGVREKARTLDSWYFSSLDGPQASWVSQEMIERQCQIMTSQAAFKRLWLNQWVADSGGDHLDHNLIKKACKITAPDPEPKGILVAGLDVGHRRDASAFTVLEVDRQEQEINLVHHKKWLPSEQESGEVIIEDIVTHISKYNREHKLESLYADSWQGVQLCQNLRHKIPCIEVYLNEKENDFQAKSLLRSLQDQLLQIYPDDELLEELGKILIVEKTNEKLRIEAPRDETGHCDIVSAIAVSIGRALRILEYGNFDIFGFGESVLEPVEY